MSALLLIKCDGLWPKPGRETCPAFLSLPIPGLEEARQKALDAGWSLADYPDQPELCPAHLRGFMDGRFDVDGKPVPDALAGTW